MNTGFVELERDEQVIAIVRRAFFWPLKSVIATGFMGILPFFLFFPLLLFGIPGLTVLIALCLFSFWWLVRFFIVRGYSMLIVSDKRIIDVDQSGIIAREILEMPLSQIKEAILEPQGFFARRFHIGSVKIISEDTFDYDIVFRHIKNPAHVIELIHEVKCLVKDEEEIYEEE